MENNTCEIYWDKNQVRYCAMIKDRMISGYIWTNKFGDSVAKNILAAVQNAQDIVLHAFCFPSTFTENPSSVWDASDIDPWRAFKSIKWTINSRLT